MYCRIHPDTALRSWKDAPFAYYRRFEPYAKRLTPEEFECLLQCDAENDLSPEGTVGQLIERGLAEPCRKGEHPSEWSKLHSYDHRYVPAMNLMVTGKCNYNCRHCFNAADFSPLMSEWKLEDLCRLLDEAQGCGIHAITITGGEPMLHPHFMDILAEIMKRDMFVYELNTNGHFISGELLGQMKRNGCRPLMKISFDGIGFHDWMRAKKGAQEHALRAISECVEHGFRVKVQTQVNRVTYRSIPETVDCMEAMGVENLRLIRTTEGGRGALDKGKLCLSFEEYYEKMLALAKEYTGSEHRMLIEIWNFMVLYPEQHAYEIIPVICPEGKYRSSMPVCRDSMGMIAVNSEGDVLPCLQMGGTLKALGIQMENLHETSLSSIIKKGFHHDTVCLRVGEFRHMNDKCSSCRFFPYCCGGCRALGLAFSGKKADMLGADYSKCRFFENGWYDRITKTLSGWTNLSPMGTQEEQRYHQLEYLFSWP